MIFLAIPLFLLACYLLAREPNSKKTTKQLLLILTSIVTVILFQVWSL